MKRHHTFLVTCYATLYVTICRQSVVIRIENRIALVGFGRIEILDIQKRKKSMPVHYACILNFRNQLVIHGVSEKTQTIFKTQVIQNVNRIIRFGFSEVPIESNLRILFHNWDTVTAAIVVGLEVDRQECGEFLE